MIHTFFPAGTGRNLNKKTEIKRVDGIISYCSEKCKRRKPDLADGDRKMLICSITKSNIDRNDAVSNIANAIKTIYALEHFDKKHILSITKDRIHEPYRKPLIKDFNNFQSTALKAGALALVISGSGSTCLTVSDKRLDIDEYFQNVKVDKEGVKCLKSS